MKMLNAVFLLVGLLVATGAYSAVMAIDSASCEEWKSDQGMSKSLDQMWLLGYLSGMTVRTDKDLLKGIEVTTIYQWMDNYCVDNLLKGVVDGGIDLYSELKKQKVH
jgi:hypothetical protein